LIHRCSNFVHAIGDDFRKLHHLLAQRRVFFNLALNAFGISLWDGATASPVTSSQPAAAVESNKKPPARRHQAR
jgi:hypothetical protein